MDHAAALALIAPFEGRVPHMYLDTVGRVTVGIGNMLPTVQAALPLRWAKRDGDGEPTQIDIADDYKRVSGAMSGLRDSAYRPLTRLELVEAEIESLFGRRVDEFTGQLEKVYPLWPEFPQQAQLAILDMAFNLGVGALAKKWPQFSNAVRTMDWKAAATQSHRPQSSEARNKAVLNLFLGAVTA